MVIEHLTLNTKPKLEKYKPQSISNPNLQETKFTCHNTRDMYLHSSLATWNTKLMGMVIEHLTVNTKPKFSKYKSQYIGNPSLCEIKSTGHNTENRC